MPPLREGILAPRGGEDVNLAMNKPVVERVCMG